MRILSVCEFLGQMAGWHVIREQICIFAPYMAAPELKVTRGVRGDGATKFANEKIRCYLGAGLRGVYLICEE